jgi:hypothetical protein
MGLDLDATRLEPDERVSDRACEHPPNIGGNGSRETYASVPIV